MNWQLFSKKHQIPMVTIKDLIEYRIRHEVLVQAAATTRIPLQDKGIFNMTVFENDLDSSEHFVLLNHHYLAIKYLWFVFILNALQEMFLDRVNVIAENN